MGWIDDYAADQLDHFCKTLTISNTSTHLVFFFFVHWKPCLKGVGILSNVFLFFQCNRCLAFNLLCIIFYLIISCIHRHLIKAFQVWLKEFYETNNFVRIHIIRKIQLKCHRKILYTFTYVWFPFTYTNI